MNASFRDGKFRDDREGAMMRDVVVSRAVESLEPGDALDLGCGIGSQALMLARMGWRVTGIDASDHAVRIANDAAREHGLPARFVAAEPATWKPDQPYDLVYIAYALPGGADSHRIVHTAIEALRPGGTLIIVEWDHSMADHWGFGPDDLPSPSDLAAMVPGMAIESSESRDISRFLEVDEAHDGDHAIVAYLRARKPDDRP